MKPSPLSLEFKIACEIYRCKKKGIPCTFKEISNVFNLFGYTRKRIDEAVNTLFDWSLIHAGYDETTKSRLHIIGSQELSTIKYFYKQYWKKERKELFEN